MRDEPRSVSPGMSTDALNQEILEVSSQLLDKSRQAQQEQERAREIADSLNQLPQQQTDARRQLNEIERRLERLPAILRSIRHKISRCSLTLHVLRRSLMNWSWRSCLPITARISALTLRAGGKREPATGCVFAGLA